MHELPLVFFTVLGQTAAGAFILLIASKQLDLINRQQLQGGLVAAMILMCCGLLAAMTHVGQPLRMINMLAGFGRSPMSNEIIVSGAFTGFGLITAAGLFFNKLTVKQAQQVGWVAAVAGFLFIISIPYVYQLETVATWNTVHSTLQMVLTPLIGGGALAIVFGAIKLGGPAVILGCTLLLASKPDYLGFLAQVEPAITNHQNLLWMFQSFMLLAGIALSVFMVRKYSYRHFVPVVSSILLIFGELAGRIAFYNLWTIGM